MKPFTLSPPPSCVDGPPERQGVGYAIFQETPRGNVWFRGFGNPDGHWSRHHSDRIVYGSHSLALKAANLARVAVHSTPQLREVPLP
ncbi:MAG: hypothetical protein AAGI68_03615 [Planctomycetota bacterium]